MILIIITITFYYLISHHLKKKRREYLLLKYGDLNIVNMIMNKMFWQGQNEEQLIDSLGKPLNIDEKILKTKRKEIWKYNQTGKGRYGLRITLENGFVVGWDIKS